MSILTQGDAQKCMGLVQAVAGTLPLTVMEVECITTFDPAGAPAEQIEDTCPAPKSAATKKACERRGRHRSFNADPNNASRAPASTVRG